MKLHELGNTIAKATTNVAFIGGVGYLSAWALTSLNPVVGFAYGAAYAAAGWGVDPVFATQESTFSSYLVGSAIKTVIAANVTLAALGVSLSIKAACVLTASLIAGNLIVGCATVLATVGCTLAYHKLADRPL